MTTPRRGELVAAVVAALLVGGVPAGAAPPSKVYEEQTYLDAFSSPDLVNWTGHPNVLTTANVSWAHKAVWAPAPIERDGRYYLYFAANDIQSDAELGGIGKPLVSGS